MRINHVITMIIPAASRCLKKGYNIGYNHAYLRETLAKKWEHPEKMANEIEDLTELLLIAVDDAVDEKCLKQDDVLEFLGNKYKVPSEITDIFPKIKETIEILKSGRFLSDYEFEDFYEDVINDALFY